MFVETLPVAELEAPPEAPAWPEAWPDPDWPPDVPAWPVAVPEPDVPDPDVPLAPDCVLCEPDPLAPAAVEGREPDPDEAAGPPLCWPDMEPLPLPPEADGAFEAPPPLAPGDVAAPPPAPPAPPPLVCATPAATLKAKAATAAVLRNPYRMIETSRFRRTLAAGGGSNAQGLGKFRPRI
jgi:hypothetical protein